MNDILESADTITENVSEMHQMLTTMGGRALDFLIKAALAILIFFVITKIMNRICRWITGRMAKRNLDPSMTSFVVSIVKWGVLIFTIVQIVVTLDIVAASSIAAVIASAGVGISLAVQGTLSNFAGGILLLCLKPFKTGDYIEVPALNAAGTVQKIEMYYTTIVTIYHEAIMVPNSSLTNNQVTNYTALGRRVLQAKVGISYHADMQKAKQILERIVHEENRLEDEGRSVFVSELGESAVVLELRAMVPTTDYWPVKTEIYEKIKKAFDEAGIEIPYNQVDLHVIGDLTADTGVSAR